MKKLIALSFIAFACTSCQKIEETISSVVTETTEKAQQKAQETIEESVTEQIGKIVQSENIQFKEVFPHENNLVLENAVGKKVAFPNGTPFYVFKYNVADKDLLISTLVSQPTTDEAQSKKEFEKVDGSAIIEKITFFQKFLPANAIDLSFLDDIKNDKNIEYYKVKRFPNASTIIYNPKNEMVYQFVEVKK